MATYTKVSRSIPVTQRSALITDVEALDRIDVVDVLGRPARGFQLHTTDAADEVEYRLNSLRKISKRYDADDSGASITMQALGVKEVVEVWGAGDIFSGSGLVIESVEGLNVSSIEITGLTLSTGTTISIVVW